MKKVGVAIVACFILFLPAFSLSADHSAELFLQLGHSSSVLAVAFSPDGQTLATGSSDKTVKLWDVASRKLAATLEGHSSAVTAVAFSPDGQTLASGSDDKTVKLWDVASGKLAATLEGHSSAVIAVAFSPDGQTLASGSDDKTVKLWDVASGKLAATLEGHSSAVTAVAFSPDGQTLASGSDDKTVKLWDVASGKLAATLEGHSSLVRAVAFSPDGQTLASGNDDQTVKLWDVASRKLAATLEGHSSSVRAVAFSPDGQTLASGSSDNTVKLWDIASRKLAATLEGHIIWVNAVAFSPDGQTLAFGSMDNTVKLWDVASRKLAATLEGHSSWVNAVAFSPDGQTLASGSMDNTVKLWDVASRKLAATLEGHSSFMVSAVAFSPDGQTLASGSSDQTVKLWDVASRKLAATLEGHSSWVNAVAFSPDGQTLASGNDDKTVKLWDVASRKLAATLEGHSSSVLAVAFSPDGQTLASGSSDQTVKLWDVASRKLAATLEGHSSAVTAVAFSPDGQTLASGSGDKTVKLWDVASRKLAATLEGHSSAVTAVAFSPDGQTLASGSGDKTVKLWDVASRKLAATLEGHSSAVLAVAFSPDGQILATGSGDNTIIQWNRESGEIIVRTVLLPGNQWLVYHPRKLVYDSSYPPTQEEKYAAVRFDGQLRPVYPLEYYRKELKRENGLREALQAPQPVIKPKPFRLWWDTAENKGVWVGGSLFVLASGLVVWQLWARRVDPLEIARDFFVQTGAQIIESLLGRALLLRPQGNVPPNLVALWQEGQTDPRTLIAEVVQKYQAKLSGRPKLYVVYKDRGPDNAALQAVRASTHCDIIPIFSPMLEQALLKGDSAQTLRELEEPYLVRTDPYAESKPIADPQWFYGREELLQRLPAVLAQGQHVGIFGLRKVGKTSLIRQLRQRFISTPTVFIDCQAWPAKAESYFAEILQQLHAGLTAQAVKNLPAPLASVDAEQFRQQFLAYFDGWQGAGRRGPFLLIFDEIDKFFPHREAKDSEEILTEYVRCFRVLRGLAQTRQCVVLLVVAYRPDVNRYNLLTSRVGENPMFRSFHEEYLGFLTPPESIAMIQEIGMWKDIVWDPDAARRVFDYCGGHPLITRLFASEACEEGSRKAIDLARVEEVAANLQRTFRKNDIGNYYQEGVWDLLREDERQIFSHICQHGNAPIPESTLLTGDKDDEALTNLERFGLVASQHEQISLTSALFQTWWQRRFSR